MINSKENYALKVHDGLDDNAMHHLKIDNYSLNIWIEHGQINVGVVQGNCENFSTLTFGAIVLKDK